MSACHTAAREAVAQLRGWVPKRPQTLPPLGSQQDRGKTAHHNDILVGISEFKNLHFEAGSKIALIGSLFYEQTCWTVEPAGRSAGCRHVIPHLALQG